VVDVAVSGARRGATQRVSSCQVPKDGAPEPDTLGTAPEWLALIGSERRNTVEILLVCRLEADPHPDGGQGNEPSRTGCNASAV
jgi:hypothetical protein